MNTALVNLHTYRPDHGHMCKRQIFISFQIHYICYCSQEIKFFSTGQSPTLSLSLSCSKTWFKRLRKVQIKEVVKAIRSLVQSPHLTQVHTANSALSLVTSNVCMHSLSIRMSTLLQTVQSNLQARRAFPVVVCRSDMALGTLKIGR